MRDRKGERKTTGIVKEGRQKEESHRKEKNLFSLKKKKKKKYNTQNIKLTALVYGTTGDFFPLLSMLL